MGATQSKLLCSKRCRVELLQISKPSERRVGCPPEDIGSSLIGGEGGEVLVEGAGERGTGRAGGGEIGDWRIRHEAGG
jgi:hypothetical protein